MAHNGFIGGVAAFLGDVGRARQAASRYESLSRMSDRALAARGLSREDLPKAAFDSAFGKK